MGLCGRAKLHLIVILGDLNAQRYVKEVLDIEVIPFLRRHGPGTLQQDNARHHTAVFACNHLVANNIDVLDLPALSPDMNSFEQIWNELGKRVRQKYQMNMLNALRAALFREWNNIPNAVVLR